MKEVEPLHCIEVPCIAIVFRFLWCIALVAFGGLHSLPDVVTRPIGASVLPLAVKRSPESPNQRCLIPLYMSSYKSSQSVQVFGRVVKEETNPDFLSSCGSHL